MKFNDVAIVSRKGSDYRIHFRHMSKNDSTIRMKRFDINE